MMKRIAISILFAALCLFSAHSEVVPAGEAFLRHLQSRDSILIADQLQYGAKLEGVEPGESLALPDMGPAFGDTLVLVQGWKVDTLNIRRHKRVVESMDLELSLTISPFEEGRYLLPDLYVLKGDGARSDTLRFDGLSIDVCTIPVDTANFVPHDIKPQMRYPLTLSEIVPYVLAFQVFAMIVIAIVCLVMMRRRRGIAVEKPKEPAYIVALRSLDKFRGDRYWAAEKQKTMYSGITDALRTYIENRFDVNAEEMTTAEIFAALKGDENIPQDVFSEVKALFELSDFVKFAKHTASEEENSRAVPTAVRFVTSTYQSQLDAEAAEEEPQK